MENSGIEVTEAEVVAVDDFQSPQLPPDVQVS